MKTPAFWYKRAGALAHLLSPLGAIYGAATAARMSQTGARLPVPVVTTGNFVAGGGGKTPAALAIGRLLIAAGRAPAFVSRGYGGAAAREGVLRVDNHAASEVGDEPLLLARIAPTFVGADRLAAARLAITQATPDALILDDGLQSRAVEADIALAIVDGEAGAGNGYCLPAGPLRAPLDRQLRHVNAVVVVAEGAAGDFIAGQAARANVPVYRARIQADEAACSVKDRKVVAFAGIARPEKFLATLETLGAKIVDAQTFADHHAFTSSEIDGLRARATSAGALLVTTEKDHARLPDAWRAGVTTVAVTMAFERSFEEFLLARVGPALRREA